MRIALLQPEVLSSKDLEESAPYRLGKGLARTGHEVTLIAGHRGGVQSPLDSGMRVILTRLPPRIPMIRWYEPHVETIPSVLWRLSREPCDLAHVFCLAHAWALVRARHRVPRIVFSLDDVPTRTYLVGRRYRMEMMQRVLSAAVPVVVESDEAAEVFSRYLLLEPNLLPSDQDEESASASVRVEAYLALYARALGGEQIAPADAPP